MLNVAAKFGTGLEIASANSSRYGRDSVRSEDSVRGSGGVKRRGGDAAS